MLVSQGHGKFKKKKKKAVVRSEGKREENEPSSTAQR